MSLMKTLAKVALGVALAKGASSMMHGRGRTGGRGGLLGSLTNAGQGADQGAGGLGGALSSVLAGRSAGSPGLGGMLENLTRGRGTGALGGTRGGGLDGLLGGLLGGGSTGGLGGGAGQGLGSGATGGLGSGTAGVLGGALGGGLLGQLAAKADRPSGEPAMGFGAALDAAADPDREAPPVTPEQEAAAGLMLRAMIQAARADGVIDAKERERLLGQMDDLDPDERRFVTQELEAPVDPEALAAQVPKGLEAQIYAVSLMAIDVDTHAEIEHLRRLASALGLSREEVERAHEEVGAPPPA